MGGDEGVQDSAPFRGRLGYHRFRVVQKARARYCGKPRGGWPPVRQGVREHSEPTCSTGGDAVAETASVGEGASNLAAHGGSTIGRIFQML